jgi:hypothetical protein
MRGRAREAHQPEALTGRGEAALAAGSGWAGHDKAIQTCAGRVITQLWEFGRRQCQQSRRSAAWRAGAVHVVGRRACAGCRLSHKGAGTRGAARARVRPCTFPALCGSAPRRATQGSARMLCGQAGTRACCAARRHARCAARARCSAVQGRCTWCRASQGRRAAPREKETIGEKRQEENGNRSQDQGRTNEMSLGEERQ